MSDAQQDDRTEEPTPRKRKEAAEKGQGARSREVMTAFLLLASAGALAGGAPAIIAAMAELFMISVTGLTSPSIGANGAAEHVVDMARRAMMALAPIPVGLAGTALAVGAVQARGIITVEPLKPQWSRLDPLKKAKQIWGWMAVAELVKSLLKLGVVFLAVTFTLRSAMGELGILGQTTPAALLDFTGRYVVRMLLSVGGAYLFIAAADYGFQLWQHEKQIRMTREEVKREFKDSEGDQVVKVKRRTIAREQARRRMLKSVAEADVVITNPTQVAVALKYEPDVALAPIVLAIGERKVAERIRELAKEAGVPLVENKVLARALLATAKVGQTIPMDLFVAVAEILAFVYRLSGATTPGYGARR